MRSENIRNYAIAIAVLVAGIGYGVHQMQVVAENHRFFAAQVLCGRQKDNASNFNGYNICMAWQGFGSGNYNIVNSSGL